MLDGPPRPLSVLSVWRFEAGAIVVSASGHQSEPQSCFVHVSLLPTGALITKSIGRHKAEAVWRMIDGKHVTQGTDATVGRGRKERGWRNRNNRGLHLQEERGGTTET
ncbi:hypothetical protein NDU88_002976 [Pleurodeles waltl]|uniref:Uncharacterized protein n=1 Tax=Pleurodeles waltl TaxID=8319 RepID=A0AAV7PBN0_PLEWA|nr:hypothetical protein NDU88_002976 [Pleurodeles waltl]